MNLRQARHDKELTQRGAGASCRHQLALRREDREVPRCRPASRLLGRLAIALDVDPANSFGRKEARR